MSTRSFIAVEIKKDEVISVYCHSDGYVSGVGKNLLEKFPEGSDPKKLIKYIKEGDRTTFDMSYREWRNEDSPYRKHSSIEDFFKYSDEHAYLYTTEGSWLHQEPWQSDPTQTTLQFAIALVNQY